MNKSIAVTIHNDGSVTVAPQGFKGKKCKDATKFLEKSLGMNNPKSTPTGEMYAAESGTARVANSGR